jgi:hypothetical protein
MGFNDFESAEQRQRDKGHDHRSKVWARELQARLVRAARREPVSAPVTGSDSQWYKNVLKTPTVRVAAGGTEYSARATPVTDPAKVDTVVGCSEKCLSRDFAGVRTAFVPASRGGMYLPPTRGSRSPRPNGYAIRSGPV